MWFRIGYGILRNRLPSLIKAEREKSNRYSVHVRFRGIARAILVGCVTRVLEKTRKNLTDKSRIRSNFAFIQSFRFHASIPRRLSSINCNGLLVIGISGRNLESRQRYSVSFSFLLFSFFFSFFFLFPDGLASSWFQVALQRACFDFVVFFLAARHARQKLDVLLLFTVNEDRGYVQSINSSPGKTTGTGRYSATAPADSARDTRDCGRNT